MVVNHIGKLIRIIITENNINNKIPVINITKKLGRSIYYDKDYISSDLFNVIYKKIINLITRIRKKYKKLTIYTFLIRS